MSHPLKELINNKSLFESLAAEYGTPLYIYDKNQLIKNINKIYNCKISFFESKKVPYFFISSSLSISFNVLSIVFNLEDNCSILNDFDILITI